MNGKSNGLGLPSYDYYTGYPLVQTTYATHVANVVKLLGYDGKDAEEMADAHMEFERKLAAHSDKPRHYEFREYLGKNN